MKTKHSQDPDYQKILDMLRTAKPEGQTWKHFRRQFLSKQKAWQEDAPTVEDMRRILTRHPDTTFLCVSREAAGRVNELQEDNALTKKRRAEAEAAARLDQQHSIAVDSVDQQVGVAERRAQEEASKREREDAAEAL